VTVEEDFHMELSETLNIYSKAFKFLHPNRRLELKISFDSFSDCLSLYWFFLIRIQVR